MKLGEKQKLIMVKKVDFGIYLAEHMEDSERVLLPAKQAPEGISEGDELEVFLYKDSKDQGTLFDAWGDCGFKDA